MNAVMKPALHVACLNQPCELKLENNREKYGEQFTAKNISWTSETFLLFRLQYNYVKRETSCR